MQSVTPVCTHTGLGSSAFARRYLRNRVFFLFLRVLRCFSSPGSLPYVMDWRMDAWGLLMRVSPFRHLRITGYLLLPEAFRSLSRLSSALSAKASTLRPYYFNRSRNDRISWFSVSSLMYSVTSAGFVFLSFSYLVINDEIWISLMSWLISISENEFYLNSCMKFSRYIRVSETISCICYTSGLW